MLRYNIRTGVKKIKTKTALTISGIGLGAAGLAMAIAMPLAGHAATGVWKLQPASVLNFQCNGTWLHTFDTVSQGTGNDFTGTGHYNGDPAFTWYATGNIVTNGISFNIKYTGTANGSVYGLVGTIANDGSVAGTVNANSNGCTTFSMPAGSAIQVNTGTVVYDSVPSPQVAHVASQGYEATSTKELGDSVTLAGTSRALDKITVTFSDWALHSDYPSMSANSWSHPITVKVYGAELDSNGVPSNLLATKTETVNIPWKPAEDPINCPTKTTSGYAYKWQAIPGAPDTNCYNGIAFNATFDFSSLNVTMPNSVIVSVAYNTQDYGVAPIGSAGPYNSLNVGLPTSQVATVGTDNSIDQVFLNSSWPGAYSDGGTSGISVLRLDAGWTHNGTLPFQVTTRTVTSPSTVPTNKDQCKGDGWKTLTDTLNKPFKNQGDCVSYVATKQKNPANG